MGRSCQTVGVSTPSRHCLPSARQCFGRVVQLPSQRSLMYLPHRCQLGDLPRVLLGIHTAPKANLGTSFAELVSALHYSAGELVATPQFQQDAVAALPQLRQSIPSCTYHATRNWSHLHRRCTTACLCSSASTLLILHSSVPKITHFGEHWNTSLWTTVAANKQIQSIASNLHTWRSTNRYSGPKHDVVTGLPDKWPQHQ